MDISKRDKILLRKILENQEALSSTIKEFQITMPADLDNIHSMMRRGMVQTVADIFELTVPMSENLLRQIPLNHAIIKQFRNTASHNYGRITNTLAYACIIHCVDRQFVTTVKKLIKMKDDRNE